MARRKRPPEPVVDDIRVPARILDGPVIEVWVPRGEWPAVGAAHPGLFSTPCGPPEAEIRWFVLAFEARRRWRTARQQWADRHGLDHRAMQRLVPDRAPRWSVSGSERG